MENMTRRAPMSPCKARTPPYNKQMKRGSILFAVAGALFLVGCADPLEQRSNGEVQNKLERGVTGQGNLGPIDRPPDDPANEHGVPQTHP